MHLRRAQDNKTSKFLVAAVQKINHVSFGLGTHGVRIGPDSSTSVGVYYCYALACFKGAGTKHYSVVVLVLWW